jgi:hypothetical protein
MEGRDSVKGDRGEGSEGRGGLHKVRGGTRSPFFRLGLGGFRLCASIEKVPYHKALASDGF